MSKQFKDGQLKTLSELTPYDEGENRFLEGMVIGQSEVEHYPTQIVMKCPNHDCTNEKVWEQESFKQDWRDPPLVRKCLRCNSPMYESEVTKEMLKKVIISEQGVDNPLFITGFVYGEDINTIQPGMRIKMTGILRSRKTKKSDMTYKKLFDISRYELADEKPILPTDEEIKMFEELDKTEIIKSFAPHIKNMYLFKEALLLASLGGVEKQNFRGDINVLMLGDPGLAKTQLLNFAVSINHKSDYASGKSASGAGLFGGIDKTPDGTNYAKAGIAVLCNGGILAMDEMEKMNPEDRVYAHEVMESQTFTLRKIVPVKWTVKISIMGAANPRKSIWNPELSINENVNLPASLLSRFGLIFLARDIPNKQNDLDIADHIERMMLGEIECKLAPDMMMKFINYAKQLKPVPNQEAIASLKKWWADLRAEGQEEESISVDIRTLMDLHRIAQAYAKLDLSSTIEVSHAKRAIQMLNDSLKTLGMNTPGEKNTSMVDSLDKMGYVQMVFKEELSMVKAQVKMYNEKPHWWHTEEQAHDFIIELHGKGTLIEPTAGVYQWA